MSIESAIASPLSAGRQRVVRRLARWNRPHLIGVGALTAIIAAMYSGYALVLYATYRESNYDLVIFDQAIRSYSRFHLGISVIKGLRDGFGPNFSVLGDHFSPIDMALAPLYWIWDGPQTLLVAQAVLFALAIPWLWVFTRRALGGTGRKATAGAYLACIAYGLSWPLAAAITFDYHEVAFVPVLTAIALERLQAGRLRAALIALGFLLLVKEDMGLLVAGLGIALAVWPAPMVRRQRLLGIILVVVGIGYTYFATQVLIPAFGGRANFYWAYSHLGTNIPQVISHILHHPLSSFVLLFTPSIKLTTWGWLFAAFCFLPLLSPLTIAALPLLVERMLADPLYSHWWGVHYHYNAFIVTILAFAAVDGAIRLDRWATRLWRYLESGRASPAAAVPAASAHPAVSIEPAVAAEAVGAGAVSPSGAALAAASVPAAETTPPAVAPPADQEPETAAAVRPVHRLGTGAVAFACCAALCAAAIYTIPLFALGRALSPAFYRQTPREQAFAAADAKVPSGVVVAAANFIGSELSRRDTVLMWDGEFHTPPFAAPWVVADVSRLELDFSSLAEQRADVALLEQHGYRVVFRRLGIIVLHRPGPPHLYTTPTPVHIPIPTAG